MSNICALRVAQNPDILLWLGQPEICAAPRGYGEMRRTLHGLTEEPVAAENFRALRRWKGREMTRIALRELAEAAPLEETTAELSLIAGISLAQAFVYSNVELRKRFGSPTA